MQKYSWLVFWCNQNKLFINYTLLITLPLINLNSKKWYLFLISLTATFVLLNHVCIHVVPMWYISCILHDVHDMYTYCVYRIWYHGRRYIFILFIAPFREISIFFFDFFRHGFYCIWHAEVILVISYLLIVRVYFFFGVRPR